ncbi:hypothetical protein ACFOY8_11845 [Thalassospira xianhensis]|uniref:Uncharacterized protein n=1 Tax=Thalassospira xianhensis MCCC 1A02616 TaxID=1177929 RepID=A0A367U7C9_9PROT|nr:hypothetical protein [Thalassospira xianhensis]RCK04128.1 hypothetical protein TH5_21320 [Thalassospira xianhensis MCCC 1A02616]
MTHANDNKPSITDLRNFLANAGEPVDLIERLLTQSHLLSAEDISFLRENDTPAAREIAGDLLRLATSADSHYTDVISMQSPDDIVWVRSSLSPSEFPALFVFRGVEGQSEVVKGLALARSVIYTNDRVQSMELTSETGPTGPSM